MAAITFPRQQKRWGNESTNFYGATASKYGSLPMPQRVNRCDTSQYASAGHFHVGAKMLNGFSPQDRYGTPIAYKLRPEDQRLPRSLQSSEVNHRRMKSLPVDLYQSHVQSHAPHSMPGGVVHAGGVVQPLNEAFYTTTYHREISRPASGHSVLEDSGSLTSRVLTRSRSAGGQGFPPSSLLPSMATATTTTAVKPVISLRRFSVPHPSSTTPTPGGVVRSRRRERPHSASSFPSRSELLKDINAVFPSPVPPPLSVWESRPSSAVKATRIRGLRGEK